MSRTRYWQVYSCIIMLVTCTVRFCYAENPPFQGRVTAKKVNFRAGGNQNYEVLGQLTRNEHIQVYDKKYGWYKIEMPLSASCYVAKEFVVKKRENGTVTGNRLNVRARPIPNASVLGQLFAGDTVHIRDTKEKWYEIDPPDGMCAWVSAKYVEYYAATPLPMTSLQPMAMHTVKSITPSQPLQTQPIPLAEKIITVAPPIMPVSQKHSPLPTPSIAPTVTSEPFTKGMVLELGHFFARPGTHKLIDDNGKLLFYLKSKDIDLNKYIYYKVAIWGDVLTSREGDAPVLLVYKIKADQGV